MLQTFDCPKCGAPVSYEKDVVGANLTARCSYCNSSLSVPDETRGRPARIISRVNIDLRNTVSGGRAIKWILLLVMVPVIGVVIGAIAMGGLLVPLLRGSISPGVNRSTPSGGTGIPGTNRSAMHSLRKRLTLVRKESGRECLRTRALLR